MWHAVRYASFTKSQLGFKTEKEADLYALWLFSQTGEVWYAEYFPIAKEAN